MKEFRLTPSQSSSFESDVDGVRYGFRFTYNSRLPLWTVDLSLNGAPLVTGAAAVIGCQLFQGDGLSNVPRGLYMLPLDQSTEDALYSELGVRVQLVQITEEDGLNVPTV